MLVVAGALSLAATLFAVGAAVTSDDESQAAPVTSAAAGSTSPPEGPGASAPIGSGDGAAPRFDIEIAGFEFGPTDAVVAVGTEVIWTNNDGFDHTIVADGQAFPTSPNLGDGDTYSFVFTEPGTYQYLCGIHPQMTGTITVEA